MEGLTKNQCDILSNSDKTIKPFTLAGRTLLAKVIDVYDGDTCKVNIFLYENVLKQFTIRMMGYDCPELRTKNVIEKKFGYRSKEIMVKLVANKLVKLECLDFDKYGRILGNIYIKDDKDNEICVNKFMVDNHLGYNYFGDTKVTFDTLLNSGYYSETDIAIPNTKNYGITPIEDIIEILIEDNPKVEPITKTNTKVKPKNRWCFFSSCF